MERPAALVFDLDGTLIDSRRDITTAINRMRAELELPAIPLAEVVTMVGEGARLLVERALGSGFSPEQVDQALVRYLGYYGEVCLDETVTYPGIVEMLEALAPHYPLALLSNKGESLSRRILGALGLSRFFAEIVGGDSLPTRKPDPAGLHLLADRLGVPLDRLMLVGDTWIDAETAHNAGCGFALVEWGFPRPPKLGEVKADLRVAGAGELTAALR
ncbi:MAG TPA: HAD-IA family hydrolase [Thermoanaerobaculia bacterium]|jgi:phosphoglycolate phosphatase|nr:HAD-IA family hydrolase [Thermoanaerobaculia bacterium]